MDGLEGLARLEVLDLHGNQLAALGTGLGTLSELKVLNVAGNQLRSVVHEELHGLAALEELNLRRNRLRRVDGVVNAPNLNKLFLSNNNIQRYITHFLILLNLDNLVVPGINLSCTK